MKKTILMLAAVFTMALLFVPSAFAGNDLAASIPGPKSDATAGDAAAVSKSRPKGLEPRTDVPDATEPVIELDTDQVRLLVRYKASNKYGFSVAISYNGGNADYYTLYAINADEYFPLANGNGTYSVMILKRLDNSGKASVVKKMNVNVNVKDQNAAFLASNYFVNWENSDASVNRAQSLSGKKSKGSDVSNAIYNEIVKIMNYDESKLGKLPSGYVPDMDTTYNTKKGVCYDTSVLLAGMLRSTGVPTRFVKGYAAGIDGYHAWNEILIDGKWVVVDATADAIYEKGGHSYKMAKNSKDYKKTSQY